MRPLESLASSLILFGLLWISFDRAVVLWPLVFACLALAALVLHAAKEGAHWQMVPIYLSFGLLSAAIFTEEMPRALLCTLGLVAILTGEALCRLLPMFRFAPLTGPYEVGTAIHHLIDRTRQDASPSGHRELMVQLWYPAEPSRHPFAPYRRFKETTRVSSYQAVLQTSSRLNAPVAQSQDLFPVLLFNPAWNGRRTQNTFLTEELASHGFVVAAIDHTGNSEPIAFPDGRVVYAQHVRAMEDVSTSTPEEIQRIGNTEVDKQTLDCRFVLDELARWSNDPADPWHQCLDTDNAGTFGHSLGGATAIECWATDPRIRAAMNMDGWTFGTQASSGRRQDFPKTTKSPLLFLYESNYNPFPTASSGKSETEQQVDAWDAAHVQQLLQAHSGYRLKINGADHMNFTDRTVSSPLRRLAGGGAIDPRLAHRILRAYAVSFFKQALSDQPSLLLQAETSRYPEVSAPMP